ncbi:MAG TPA: TIGR03435 family protein [Bryobacteraceae bacterium]|nr:TIGR03435 family protein [Bryobacteraceae bacterium]
MRRLELRTIALGLALASRIIFAQPPAAPSFEVASIKPATMPTPGEAAAGKMHVGLNIDAQRVDIGFFSLRDLIMVAYRVKPYQVVGPDWMLSERFDVQAKIPEGASREQVPEMLQALLGERFKLATHRDSKEHNVYALVVAKGGPKLKEAAPDAEPPPTPEATGPDGKSVQVTRDGKGGFMVNGRGGAIKMRMGQSGVMHYEMAKMSMKGLADMLTPFLDRPVVDMSELKGFYEVTLDLSMENMIAAARANGVVVPRPNLSLDAAKQPADAASDPAGGTVFQSIQQLGLKLEARKAPLETIVVDHLEKSPTEN